MSLENTEKVVPVKASGFSWDIDNIRLMNKNVGDVLTSPDFLCSDTKWQLKIYPNGCSQSHEGYVSVVVQSRCQLFTKEYILIVSFLNYYNKLLFSCMECVTFSPERVRWQVDRLAAYDEFVSKLNHVTPANKLKIKCELLYSSVSATSNLCTPMNFENFFNCETLSDVKLSVKGKIVYGHKIILSNKSKVYAAMFEHPMQENLDNVVHVEDIEYDVLLEMLRFVYSGRVNNMKNNVKELLIAADKYAIDDLKFICGECLCASLSIDNVVEYLELADQYNAKALRATAINFIVSNAKALVDIPSFKLIVDLRGDLVFEVLRLLVQDQTKTPPAYNSRTTLPLSTNFRFNESTQSPFHAEIVRFNSRFETSTPAVNFQSPLVYQSRYSNPC